MSERLAPANQAAGTPEDGGGMPLNFERVASVDAIAKGAVLAIEVGSTPVAVVHAEDDNFYAIYDECSHAAVALSEGEVDGCTLECWLHGSRFDLRTGEPTGLPATEPVPVYPVEIRDGEIYVGVKQ